MKKSTSAAALALHSALAGLGLLSPLSLFAQTTVTYTDAQVSTTNRATTPADPLTVTLASGTARENGVVSGAGSLTKTGAGTLALGATNTYSGGTFLSAGTLELSADNALGTGAITITGGGLRAGGQARTLSNALFTSGSFTVGRSTTFAGTTTLNANTTIIASNPDGPANSDTTFSGAIVGDFGVTLAEGGGGLGIGSGYIVFSGANTYTGGTTLRTRLSIASDAALGAASGALTMDGGTLRQTTAISSTRDVVLGAGGGTFVVNGFSAFGGSVSGSGGLTQAGGFLGLFGPVTYTGATTITNGGVLKFGNSGAGFSTVQTSGITIESGGLYFGGDVIYSGSIAGAGHVKHEFAGTTVLTGTVAHTGGTQINAGAIQIGDGGTSGSLSADVALSNGGNLAFKRSDAVTYAGVVSGSGTLTQLGTGTLTLSGVNTYNGGTIVNAGLINFSALANFGTGNVTLDGGGLQWATGATTDVSSRLNALGAGGATFDTNGNNVTLASVFSGTGALTKSGTGALTLTKANTYTGGTAIVGGQITMGNAAALGTGSVSLASGTVLDASSHGFNLNRLGGAGTITSSGAYAASPASDVTLATNLAGTASLTKSGAGTLTLSGTNTYSGATTVTDGLINFSSLANLGTGSITLDGGGLQWASGTTTDVSSRLVPDPYGGPAAIFDTNGNDVTFASRLSMATGFTKTGAGTLTLTGAGNSAYPATISAGTLEFASAGTGSDSFSGSIVNNAALVVNRSGTTSINGVISGTGSLTKLGSSTLFLSGANTYTGGTSISGGNLQIGSGGSIVGNVVVNGGGTSLVFASSDALIYSGVISGSGRLSKNNTGLLTLTGANTYTGITQVSTGTLALAGSGKIGGGALYIINGGTLDLGGTTQTVAGVGGGSSSTNAWGNITAGTLATTGNIYLKGGTFANNWTGGRLWIGGDPNATVTLSGTNDAVYSDHNQVLIGHGTTGAAGIVKLGSTNALAAATENVEIWSGTLDLNGQTGVRANSLVLKSGSASSLVNDSTDGAASYAGAVTSNSTGSAKLGGAGDLTLSGVVSGTGAFAKTGAGTLTLSGTNTYSGGTTINGGLVNFATDANLGTGTITLNGGGLQWAAGNTIDISTRLNALGAGGGVFNTNGNHVTLASALSGAGALTKSGTGTLTLTNANTYTGGTAITGGQLTMGNAGALGTGSVGVAGGATLDAAGYGFDLNRLSGAGTITSTGAYTAALASNVTLATSLAGTASLTKTGAGTLTLSGPNTYSGGTTITGGLVGFTTVANLGAGNITLDGGGLLWPSRTLIDISSRLNPIGAGGATFAFDGAYNNLATFATALTGSGGITKAGIGTLYLDAANTYLGPTTIRDGEVGIRNNGVTTFGTLGAGLTTIGEGQQGTYASLSFHDQASAGNGTFIANAGASVFFNGTSTASHGTFTMAGGTVSDGYGADLVFQQQASAGSATITLNGGTVAGAFGGNLYVGDNADLGTATFIVNGGTNGGLGAGISFYNDATGGTATVKLYGNGFLDLSSSFHSSGDGSPDLPNNVSIGSLEGDGRVLLGGGLTVGTNNTSTVFSGVIQDGPPYSVFTSDYSLTKAGAGTLTLSGTNTYSGGTTITGGQLTMGSAGALGTGSVGVASGTTLDASSYGFDLNRLSGAGTITSSGAYTASPASDVTLATNLTGTASLAKTGAGTLTLTGANTYSGGTSISGWGTLEFSSGANLGTGNITLDGGILKWAAGNTTDLSSRLNILNENGGAFDTNGNNVTFASAIVGDLSYSQFVKLGAGTLTLSGATVTEFFIGGGTLDLGTGAYQGNGLLIGGNFGLDSDGYGPTAVILSGAGTSFSIGREAHIGYTNEFSASLTISGGASFSSTGSATTYVGYLSTAESTLTVTGAGSTYTNSGYLQIGTSSSGRSSFIVSGGASASAGTTEIGRSGALGANSLTLTGAGSTFTTGTLTLAESATDNGTLNLGSAAGNAATAAGILDTDTVTGGLGAATLQFNTTGTALAPNYFTRDGTHTGTGVNTTGNLSLVNTAGTTVLFGTLAHTGATWINGGTLVVNGSLVSSAVTVASGATLGGTGGIGGFTTLQSGGRLAPGNSPGTLTFTGGLALDVGAILDFELGATSDLVVVSGGTLSGPSSGKITINLTDSGGFTAGIYTLIDASGASLSSIGATSFDLGATIAGYTYTFGQDGDRFQLIATAAIPEPATFATLLGAAGCAAGLFRRRRAFSPPDPTR